MKIAIDWSHTKDLTTYDGKKVKVETIKQILARINKDGDESTVITESIIFSQSPSAILEQACFDLMLISGEENLPNELYKT